MQSNPAIQMIQYENATGMQLHPEFSPEFTSFLVKLMRQQIDAEGLNSEEILKQIESMQGKNLALDALSAMFLDIVIDVL